MDSLRVYGIDPKSKAAQGVEAMFSVLSSFGFNKEESEDIASIFLQQFSVEGLPERFLDSVRWRPLYAGVVKNGYIVRVKPNLFSGNLVRYNGRVGRIINQKAGRGQVQFFLGNFDHWFSLEDLEYFL